MRYFTPEVVDIFLTYEDKFKTICLNMKNKIHAGMQD